MLAKILVIDDDITLLANLSLQLEEAGYNVCKTSDVPHAEILIGEEHPDLILLEVTTGNDAGWTLLERVAPTTPTIVVSALGREEDVVRGMDIGAIDYIAKPYRSAELLTRVRIRLGKQDQAVNAMVQPVPEPHQEAAHEVHVPTVPAPLEDAFAAQIEETRTDSYAGTPPQAPPSTPTRANKEVSVFMTDTEELALLRATRNEPSDVREDSPDTLPLGKRLNRERMRRRLTLVQAESDLHIRMWYLQAIEEEKFALLPRGPLAADMLRRYVNYLGVDVDKALEEYHALHYTPPVEPPNNLGSARLRRVTVPRWIVFTLAIILALTVSGAGIFFVDPTGVNALSDNLRTLITNPTATPTLTPTVRPSATPTNEPTATPSPTPTPTPEPPPAPPPPPPPITSTDELTPAAP